MNKVNLVGHITTDPNVKTVNERKQVRFTIKLLRDCKETGAYYDYISCVAYSYNADFIEQHFKCGDSISIVGTLRTKKHETTERTYYSTRVLVEEVSYI